MLQVFINTCLRRIINIQRSGKIANKELYKITDQSL